MQNGYPQNKRRKKLTILHKMTKRELNSPDAPIFSFCSREIFLSVGFEKAKLRLKYVFRIRGFYCGTVAVIAKEKSCATVCPCVSFTLGSLVFFSLGV